MKIVEQAAAENGLARVSKVAIEIGQFSGVEVDALEIAFSAYRKGTILEGAEIKYLTPPLLLFCRDCQNEYVGDVEDLRCPACEGSRYRVVQGRELKVKSISVLDEEK